MVSTTFLIPNGRVSSRRSPDKKVVIGHETDGSFFEPLVIVFTQFVCAGRFAIG